MNQKIRKENQPTIEIRARRWKNNKACAEKEKNMLEKNSPKPLYQQLKDILVDAIDSEKWKANEKIPSENELSSIYGLSRMTVRSVLTDLVKEGLLYRVQGKGTFVAEKIVTVSPSYIGIREQLEKMDSS